jgi:nicotinamidase-related amidase
MLILRSCDKVKILVVVDMQNDFLDGPLGTPEAQAIVGNVVKKIQEFDGDEIHITMDTHHKNYLTTQEGKLLPVPHCVGGTEGWNLNKEIGRAIHNSGKDCMEHRKGTFGSVDMAYDLCFNTSYVVGGRNMEEIILVGVCTDICVISNALLLKAFFPETKITVDAACCAGVTPQSHANALAAMKSCQINVENWEG